MFSINESRLDQTDKHRPCRRPCEDRVCRSRAEARSYEEASRHRGV